MSVMETDLQTWQVALIAVAVVWEFCWKGAAMWRAARKNQTKWFIALFVFNTVGILPITYLLTHRTASDQSS